MKKMNYVRPLAEVIELEVQDIITTSFAQKVDGSLDGGHEAKGNGITYVPIDGKITVK